MSIFKPFTHKTGAKVGLPPYPVHLLGCGHPIRGRALLSYLAAPVAWPDDHPGMRAHSNAWESREIARLLCGLGYDVDAINWHDGSFVPSKPYDLVLDIDTNLQRLAPLLPNTSIRLLHLTGSYGPYANRAELNRVAEFEKKTGKLYSPKRLVGWLELAERSLNLAHACSLLGNEFTLNTYPEQYRGKITLIPVSGSYLSRTRTINEFYPEKPEFLWFFGDGAVHKGLDLVLDVFRIHPEWVLHVVGNAPRERDFAAAYGCHLAQPNIRAYGYLVPGDAAFYEKFKNVFCFISPSCSEGISSAVVTCLQLGLFPILSRQTGVDLPPQCGIYLDEISSPSIERAIHTVLAMDGSEIVRQIQQCQYIALRDYSRQAYSQCMFQYLDNTIKNFSVDVGS
jgi:hypothetical protein